MGKHGRSTALFAVGARGVTDTAYILNVDAEQEEVKSLFPRTPWGAPWSEIFAAGMPALQERYDVFLDAEAALKPLFSFDPKLRVALWSQDIEAFQRIREMPVAAIVFSPSRLAILDGLHQSRRTLGLRCGIRRGEKIHSGHIAEVEGGQGVDVCLTKDFIGRVAAHDMDEGDPLDFGSVK